MLVPREGVPHSHETWITPNSIPTSMSFQTLQESTRFGMFYVKLPNIHCLPLQIGWRYFWLSFSDSSTWTGLLSYQLSPDIPLQTLTKLSRAPLLESLHLPSSAADKASGYSASPAVVCICHHGNDSQIAVRHILEQLNEAESSVCVVDVIGGLEAWTRVEKTFPRY